MKSIEIECAVQGQVIFAFSSKTFSRFFIMNEYLQRDALHMTQLHLSHICLLASRYLEKLRASESWFGSSFFPDNWQSERSFYLREASLKLE